MMFGNRAKNAPTSFLPDATSGGDYAPVQAPPADPKSGGFFGEGGAGRAIAGYVGDYLAQLGGARPIYAPIAQQRQLIQQQQVKRQNDWEDWVRQAQWERDHPKPTAPHYWETNNGSLGTIGADGKPRIVYEDPTPKVDWIRADNGDGTFTMTPVQQGVGQPATSPSPSKPAAPTPKPSGMTDQQIWAQAHEAVRNGADVNEVFRRLQSWGMNP